MTFISHDCIGECLIIKIKKETALIKLVAWYQHIILESASINKGFKSAKKGLNLLICSNEGWTMRANTVKL